MNNHLVRAHLYPLALARWAKDRGWGQQKLTEHYDEGAALHHLLVEMFGRAVIQPFRLMVAPGERSANLYAYTRFDAEELRRTAFSVSLPDTAAVLDPGQIQSKVMPASWYINQRIGFDIRLRPVVRQRRTTKAQEIDVFLAEALRDHKNDRTGMNRTGRCREAVYSDWLAARLNGIAMVERARLVRFQRSKAVRNCRVVEGPDAVIQGNLIVSDPEAFNNRLIEGIGRHRAYGYGMILLRPPDTRPPTC
ncbi:MAG: type I-E CRISPR-associated protein Cas6/Cse3/CasE [Rhodobacteraceae bacterium]|nr:type I-E CRISPR-associated protein Cas6/Cse3/CasE [Paracoccaceae bacterium]